MTNIQSIRNDDNDQQGAEDNTPNYSSGDASARADLKHDANKTNYANQVSIAVGDEEE